MNIKAVCVSLLTLAVAGCGQADKLVPGYHTGTLGQSKYSIAVPDEWNGSLLLIAHGLRDETAPLTAELDVNTPFYKGLLDDGWVIASTSYRRNGPIVRDAAADVDTLRQHVAGRMGKPREVFVRGSSMGGAVAVLLAEAYPGCYDGFLAIGAALSLHDRSNPYRMTYKPSAPIVFLTNQSELGGPTVYCKEAAGAARPPALWKVARDGHCNVNDSEGRLALDGLVDYARTGSIELFRDATVAVAHKKSLAKFRNGKAYAMVVGLGESYGNLYTQFVQDDLDRLGIRQGDKFIVGMGDRSFEVLLGKDYSDVPRGRWVAFLTAEGTLKIARNFADAAKTLGCKSGDEIHITSLQKR